MNDDFFDDLSPFKRLFACLILLVLIIGILAGTYLFKFVFALGVILGVFTTVLFVKGAWGIWLHKPDSFVIARVVPSESLPKRYTGDR
jgi:hypothetical protein